MQFLVKQSNEWYPRGIQISLHIRSPGFQAYGGDGGTICEVKTQSAKICLNFNFGGGGYYLPSQNSKCQDLPKFQFSGGGGGLCPKSGGTFGILDKNLLLEECVQECALHHR